MSTASDWKQTFADLFAASVAKYRGGHQKASGLVDTAGQIFLKKIGHSEQEFFDFVEDFARGGEPTLETALEVAAVRRDYFLEVQQGELSKNSFPMDKLPPKDAQVEGIVWLPRLLQKAEVKLRGEMPPDLMYGCGGDRPFLRSMNVELAEFLRLVWLYGDDDRKIIENVKKRRAELGNT